MSEWIKRLAEKYSEVNEKKLTGNQHKLDMDKDGDIDAADFKQMRNKKKANEEEEIVMNPKKDKKGKEHENMAAEAKLDELSPALLKRYTKKADKDAVKSFNKATDHEDDDDSTKHDKLFDRGMKRADGATKAREKLVAKGHKAPKYPNEGVMDKVHDIRRKVFGKSDAEKRAEAERNAMAGFHKAMNKAADHAPSAMGAAIKKKNKVSEGVKHAPMSEKVHTVDIDHTGGPDPVAKKHGITLKKTGHTNYSHDATGKKKNLQKYLAHHYDSHQDAKDLHPEVFKESTLPPIYSRIMEARAAADKDGKHSKKASPPEDWNEKEKNNKGAMDMKKDMAVDTNDKISNYDELGHDDASKAGRATNAAKSRPGDNAAGDKKVVNPVKGATS